jgi:hypothetical protein
MTTILNFLFKKKKKKKNWGGYDHPHGAKGVAKTTSKPSPSMGIGGG